MQKNLTFEELSEGVLNQLRDQKYMESTLTVYRRTFNRIHAFMSRLGTDVYTKDIGEQYLEDCKVSSSTMSAYRCAVRRLNDFIEGLPYICHRTSGEVDVPDAFSEFLEIYLTKCKDNGNKQWTIDAKKRSCTQFLNSLDAAGIDDLASLSVDQVSRAICSFENKDDLDRIRQFLGYLADTKATVKDFSGIVPRHRRKQVVPSVYSPDEIIRMEDSIDTSSNTGKRNLAIIRLASRMGYRAGDIAKLKWAEVDFSSGIISIVQEKTGVPLSLSMPQDVIDALVLHFESSVSKTDNDYIFRTMVAPYGRITTSIIRHVINDAINAAGIDHTDRKHGSHSLRSSLATSMINDGTSYETVRRLLGHTDPNAIKHYAKADIENLRKCAIDPPDPTGRFGDFLGGKGGD